MLFKYYLAMLNTKVVWNVISFHHRSAFTHRYSRTQTLLHTEMSNTRLSEDNCVFTSVLDDWHVFRPGRGTNGASSFFTSVFDAQSMVSCRKGSPINSQIAILTSVFDDRPALRWRLTRDTSWVIKKCFYSSVCECPKLQHSYWEIPWMVL
jgi:hypothetical protein